MTLSPAPSERRGKEARPKPAAHADADAPARPGGGHDVFYRVIRRIPPGTVATYGQVATMAGRHGAARQVGYALAALPAEADVPWHRVINAKGEISLRAPGSPYGRIQRDLLRAEGVTFDSRGRVDLARCRWDP